jgi:hypothetical protein
MSGDKKLVRLRIADYDPNAKVPVLFGDPDGEVFIAAGDLVLMGGEVGAGKTMTEMAAALAAAFARPLFGFQCERPCKVMLVLADGDGEMQARRRAFRLGQGMGLTAEQIDSSGRFCMFVPDGFGLDNRSHFAELQEEIAALDPDLVVIESVASLMGKDRDPFSQSDLADFIATRLRPLQKRDGGTRRAMIVGAHLNKPRAGRTGNRPKDRISGGFYLVGGCDTAIVLDGVEPEKFSVTEAKRSRWGCTFRPFVAVIRGQRDEPLVLAKGSILEARVKAGQSARRFNKAVDAIKAARKANPSISQAEAVKVAVSHSGVSRSTAYEAFTAATEESGLESSKSAVARPFAEEGGPQPPKSPAQRRLEGGSESS